MSGVYVGNHYQRGSGGVYTKRNVKRGGVRYRELTIDKILQNVADIGRSVVKYASENKTQIAKKGGEVLNHLAQEGVALNKTVEKLVPTKKRKRVSRNKRNVRRKLLLD